MAKRATACRAAPFGKPIRGPRAAVALGPGPDIAGTADRRRCSPSRRMDGSAQTGTQDGMPGVGGGRRGTSRETRGGVSGDAHECLIRLESVGRQTSDCKGNLDRSVQAKSRLRHLKLVSRSRPVSASLAMNWPAALVAESLALPCFSFPTCISHRQEFADITWHRR